MRKAEDVARNIVAIWSAVGWIDPNDGMKCLKENFTKVLESYAAETRAEVISNMGIWEHSTHVAHNCPGCREKARKEALEEAMNICFADRPAEQDTAYLKDKGTICTNLGLKIKALAERKS